MNVNEDAILWAYRLFLDREPESDAVVQEQLAVFDSTQEVRWNFMRSDEFREKAHPPGRAPVEQNPFFHYAATFDPIELMRRHAVPNLLPTAGYLTNFLGVKIDPKFFPTILTGREGEVEGIPIPANWHADIAEWGTALRAIELSGDHFTMIELGCGWGCWMNNTGVVARATGRSVRVIGVEGDEHHHRFANESLATNGFSQHEISLHRGIATAREGVALFPKQEIPGGAWGSEPVFNASEDQRAKAVSSGLFDELPMVPLSQVIGVNTINLLHIDIQGGEADLVQECIELLNEKVAYMLIGTHSKQIEGRLYETLLAAGWQLEMERAAIFDISNGKPHVRVDGVQGWRNIRLLPENSVARARV
ncbi:FkbM family methyltransferase [Lysobacter capsici]|uniref:FkbM family methyltransferase n=1 Tax=Lysobacter capsici TaxID=435897 RepID=UPI000627CC4C|nr:FkbM family methyltransferase [Lysobacter capsici]